MPADRNTAREVRLGVSGVLFALCLLTLLVSLFGLFRTSGITQTRAADLQVSWQALMEDGVEGTEVVAADRLVQSVTRPVPAIHSAASWSLGMGLLSLVFFIWHLASIRSVQRGRNSLEIQRARNDEAAIARLLDEMAPLASGDLGVLATASDGTAGALAGTFNNAVRELRRLAEVQLSTSRALGESVSQVSVLTEAVELQCTKQIGHIHESSNCLLGLSSSTSALSANSADASVAMQTIANTAEALATALKTNKEQAREMHQDADMSLTRMQSMEQHASSIEETIVLLRELAQRADLLAVNATIRVSTLGGEGASSDDITRLAGEVARLADALSRTLDDIGSSTSSFRADTSEAIICIQRLYACCGAQATGIRPQLDLLTRIREESQSAQTHTSHVAEQAVLTTGVVKDLNEKMYLITNITEQTGKDVRANAAFMEGLKKIANELRQSTSDFNLPDSQEASVEDSELKSVARKAAERAAING